MNIDYMKYNNNYKIKKYFDLLLENKLIQLINKPTRITNNSKTIPLQVQIRNNQFQIRIINLKFGIINFAFETVTNQH